MNHPALITTIETQQDRIEDGDVALVLKADGSFRVVQCWPEGEIDRRLMTPRQLEQGTALLAFSLLLRDQEMMEIIAGMAQERRISDFGKLN